MHIFIVNSFNASTYVGAALNLVLRLRKNGCFVIVVFGGVEGHSRNVKVSEDLYYVTIPENLSDNNGFLGVSRWSAEFRPWEHAMFVYVHDTCDLIDDETFQKSMKRLKSHGRFRGWKFAHSFGLYNIGVCDFDFMLFHGQQFDGITDIPKSSSIELEQGREIKVCNRVIQPLISHSTTTLATTCNETQIPSLDFFSVFPFIHNSLGERFVSILGSLGLYKLVGTKISYFVPIWASQAHRVRTHNDWKNMHLQFGNLTLSAQNGTIIGNIAPWIHLNSNECATKDNNNNNNNNNNTNDTNNTNNNRAVLKIAS